MLFLQKKIETLFSDVYKVDNQFEVGFLVRGIKKGRDLLKWLDFGFSLNLRSYFETLNVIRKLNAIDVKPLNVYSKVPYCFAML